VQAKTAELAEAKMELTELHTKVQQYERANELLEQQMKEAQVCILHMSCSCTLVKLLNCHT